MGASLCSRDVVDAGAEDGQAADEAEVMGGSHDGRDGGDKLDAPDRGTREPQQYLVMEEKLPRSGPGLTAPCIGHGVELGQIITALETVKVKAPSVERVRFLRNGVVGWLSVLEGDNTRVLRPVDETIIGQTHRRYEVLCSKMARREADKSSEVIACCSLEEGEIITALETKVVDGPTLTRVRFDYEDGTAWLSVQDVDGTMNLASTRLSVVREAINTLSDMDRSTLVSEKEEKERGRPRNSCRRTSSVRPDIDLKALRKDIEDGMDIKQGSKVVPRTVSKQALVVNRKPSKQVKAQQQRAEQLERQLEQIPKQAAAES